MLMIRLARVGARKQPHYRIVVIEKDRARNGRSVEVVGTYNPRTEPATYDLKRERIEYWTAKGAQMSTVVAKLVAKPVPTVAEIEAKAEAKSTPEPKTAVETKAAVEPQAEPESKAISEPETAAEPNTKTEPEVVATSEPAAV